MLVIRTGNHITPARIANRENPEQSAYREAVWFGSAMFVFLCGRKLMFDLLGKWPKLSKTSCLPKESRQTVQAFCEF